MDTNESLVDLREFFHPLFADTGGIDSWMSDATPETVANRINSIREEPISRTQLNQLLVLSHEAGVSEGFFEYYWLRSPATHPWDISCAGDFKAGLWDIGSPFIVSKEHLRWGFYRFYIDALLYFGNIRAAYRKLRIMDYKSIINFFDTKTMPEDKMLSRGKPLALNPILKDDRYLIAEMACKSYNIYADATELENALLSLYRSSSKSGRTPSIRNLIESASNSTSGFADRQREFEFSATDILDDEIESEEHIVSKVRSVAERFTKARDSALRNTKLYLSMVGELDAYVATSMRNRDDFRSMASFCERLFQSDKLKPLKLRYFDPTMSAASGHEDKGLIECLMVKSAKILIYAAGTRDSYGKDAEAAMALSLGKHVIFYCDEEQRQRFYRDIHPLSRLIHFSTGIAVGALVVSNPQNVIDLTHRIFTNSMRYSIVQDRPGHLRLKEQISESVVRIQTGDPLLRETFWNYYHGDEVQ